MGNDRMEKLLDKKKEIEREISRIRARENAEKRKEDTRRKIIAGALFLRLAESDSDIKNRLTSSIEILPERDRKLFLSEEP
jgi:large subunit ribosomal protein L7/L12